MYICVVVDNPETATHPVIGAVLRRLQDRHSVRLCDVRGRSAEQVIARENTRPLDDLYVLKSHAPQALTLAHALELRGALVVNSWASSSACQNRVRMSELMLEAGLPWPPTRPFPTLRSLLDTSDSLSFPFLAKSAVSYRGDLVAAVGGVEELEALSLHWREEPIIVQDCVAGDGWDIKLWVIDQQVFAARRRSTLATRESAEDIPLRGADLPEYWKALALEIGRVFDLRLFGVDLLISGQGPIVVDVNSFPGFRGVPGAASALIALIERLGETRGVQR